ncbi:hypothetical protein C8R41DRAFT_838467 [Lentinula lateritia]|uniref:Uncharacterized protein n=1 Tax=Lentinula lateritia TaxID=40482 RepID=A0ABQ8VEB7_9AGAR|nr:hypothetical protein C8R41DRAFT_838467 [Lentinula lateritia]
MVLFFLLLGLALLVNADGDVACSGTGLDWYIDMVGESPFLWPSCFDTDPPKIYSVQVGVMNVNTPPDACNEQVADCCCNSVAFTLSMFCLNCQQGIGTSGNGIDAGQGAYQLYLQGSRPPGQWCSPVTNQSLPNNIDTAVCDRNIKIIDDIRTGLFWSDGSCVWSYEAISEDVGANNNNAFTHCASSTSTSASTSTSSSTPNAIASSPTTSTSADSTSGNTVTVATQASDTTKQPSPSSSSNSASSATPASGISTTSFTSISGSTIILGSTFTVIYPSSISNSGSSLVSTSASGNTSSTAPASGSTSGSSQTFLTPSSRMSQGLIGGITGAAIGAVCVVLALWFFCRSLRKRKDAGKTATHDTTLVNEPFTDQPTSWYTTTGSNTESSTPFMSRPRKLEFEGRSDPSTQSPLISVHYDDPETDDQNNGSQEPYSDVMSSNVLFPMRHTDAGPVQVTVERRMSGSLPPAYGEQIS